MDGLENSMGLQHGNEGILNCPVWGMKTTVSEMTISSVSMAMPSGVANPFPASSAWDPLVSLSEIHTFGGSLMVSRGMSSNTQLVHHMSDSNFADVVPSYGIRSFLEIGDISNTVYLPDCYQSNEAGLEKRPISNKQSQGEGSTPEEGETGSAVAPSENRRKRGPACNYTLIPNKKAEGDAIEDSGKCSDSVKEQNKKKPKVDQKSSASLRAKQSTKQEKDDSHGGEVPEENFVHVRARKGQATSNHSLAERVRREKISERMRLLQELVPGCNKITGKAVMLDEIINYVQSLQQQVEFLSMKLAIVNPELNFNVAKDILQSCIGHGPIGGYGTLASMPSTSIHMQSVFVRDIQSFKTKNLELTEVGRRENQRI